MDVIEFAKFHRPALVSDEIRHNIILSILKRGLNDPGCQVRFWSLGAPGACAVQQGGYGIVLGDIGQAEAVKLASDVRDLEFPSVMGSNQTAVWFVEAAKVYGHEFPSMMSQTIHLLDTRPTALCVRGNARPAVSDDFDLVAAWLDAFVREAVPEDKQAARQEAEERIKKMRVFLWCVDDRPVAMSCIGRVLETGVAIAPVYTPPDERCRGYAGAVTAAVVNWVLDRDYRYACLYTDNNNLASNRCYANIGFRSYCHSRHYHRGTSL